MIQDIRNELIRLCLHPVNLDVADIDHGRIALKGSLLAHWAVPITIEGEWFLRVLVKLPDAAGPRATMESFSAAFRQRAE